MCNKALKGDIPTAWKQVVIIPLLPENYRGLSLTSVAAKIYNLMILLCITPHIDPLLWTNQNGFCQGRSTVSQFLTLHHVIEEVKEHNLCAILTFVDFKKAFDSINGDKMFSVLLVYGISSQIIKGIKGLYHNTMAQVVTKMATQISFQSLLEFNRVTHCHCTHSSSS